MHNQRTSQKRTTENGNILVMILIAIVLIGLLTVAIQSSSRPEGSTIDGEALIIRATEVQRYASELERAVNYIMQDGKSESDIRFAHPNFTHSDYGDLSADADPSDQVFHASGGAAEFRDPPDGIQTSTGGEWEFYGGTHIPGMGTGRAELIAVLPNVTQAFCDRINELNNQSGTPTDTGAGVAAGGDPGACLHIGALGRFDDAQQFYNATVNTVDDTTFEDAPESTEAAPAPQACVLCSRDSANHFYHVLLVR